jgi:hypothetical protein
MRTDSLPPERVTAKDRLEGSPVAIEICIVILQDREHLLELDSGESVDLVDLSLLWFGHGELRDLAEKRGVAFPDCFNQVTLGA